MGKSIRHKWINIVFVYFFFICFYDYNNIYAVSLFLFPVNSTYQLMLTLIPANIPDLARVSNITLLEPGMMIPEDGECQRFPDQLFDITVGGQFSVSFCVCVCLFYA